MKLNRLCFLYLVLLITLSACQPFKETPAPEPGNGQTTPEFTFTPTAGSVNTFVTISIAGFDDDREKVSVRFNKVDAIVKEITDKFIVTAVPVNATTGKITLTLNNRTFTSATDFEIIPKNKSLLTGSWVQKADFPGSKRSGVSAFANAASGFVTVGANGDFTTKDTWQYQAAPDQWVQRTDFPGVQRFGAVSFTIGKKAYLVTGFAYYGRQIKDFWEFDTETFIWTRKADFPGADRKDAVAFAVNNKGYVTTGLLDYFEPELKDVWEYDPATDKWQQKADIPFTTRKGAAGFNIGDKGYVGMGTQVRESSEEKLNDFWEYEPASDKWIRKADFPEYLAYINTAFGLNQQGYLLTGSNECWQYDPVADQWREKASLPATNGDATSFVVGNQAYILVPYIGQLYQFVP